MITWLEGVTPRFPLEKVSTMGDLDIGALPQASAKVCGLGIMCFNPSAFGLATSSRSRYWALGILLERNSSFAFRGALGMNHVESRMETDVGFDWVISLTCFGVSRRGAADEDIFLENRRRAWVVDDRSIGGAKLKANDIRNQHISIRSPIISSSSLFRVTLLCLQIRAPGSYPCLKDTTHRASTKRQPPG
jgi:hypothetical protein